MCMKSFATLLTDAYERWSRDGGPLLAAGVAYYVALSLLPVLLLLIAGLGFFFSATEMGRDAENTIMQAVSEQMSPQLADQVRNLFAEVREKASFGGPLGVITLLVAGLAMFSQFDHAFDRIWNIYPKSDRGLWHSIVLTLRNRLTAFAMLLGLGAIVIAVFLAGVAVSALTEFADGWVPYSQTAAWMLEAAITIALNVLAFTLIYRLITKIDVQWSDAVVGGLFAAVAWEIGRQVLSHFVINGRYTTAYGLLGTFMGVMLWAYYAVSVLFFGAELIQALRAGRGETT